MEYISVHIRFELERYLLNIELYIYTISGHGVSLLLQFISRAQNEREMSFGQSAQTTARVVGIALC